MPSHGHVFSCLAWLALLLLGSSSAIRGLRLPAESAAGRYLSSGVVQRSSLPQFQQSMMADDARALDEIAEGSTGGVGSGPPSGSPQGGHWLGLGKRATDVDDDDDNRFTPYVSVGVLSNMQQFFDSLRTNLDSLEELPVEEKELLLGRANENRASRPTATAAYLHALRSHRPSHKLRSFVAQAEPAELRGTNSYDPAWLWAGLGRRRR